MSAVEREDRPPRPPAAPRTSGAPPVRGTGAGRVPMGELLASCAAARAVSTPPGPPVVPAPGRAGRPGSVGRGEGAGPPGTAGRTDPAGAVAPTAPADDDGTRGAAA
ncbi:hypothetical protein GCM10018793_29590 [Streptomyces sulfonofaciens]|uniref:Uncharacterized protein n=1 Tax=Streptomyces sulfonofaciens TaxID=68272 RepID=A0A919L0W7_9ACTN|nr:hypothetical protein [Streptomyces sulfonofaciens]GHH78626.1 hypothetical protein GCM10018793_29590 [Streptomyces sulfonofaciens]